MSDQLSFFTDFGVSDEIIDEALRIGFNSRTALCDIIMIFRRARGCRTATELIKNLYGTDGFGFLYNGEKVAVWHDNTGYYISKGNSAKKDTAKTLPWPKVTTRIAELLDNGSYAAQSTIDKIEDYELSVISERIVNFYRDIDSDSKNIFPELKTLFDKIYGYPDMVNALKNALTEDDFCRAIYNDFHQFMAAIENGTVDGLMRYRYSYRPTFVYELLKGKIEQKPYSFEGPKELPKTERFITIDEIKHALLWKYPYYNGNKTVYDFFLNNKDLTKRSDFLRKEYGISGSCSDDTDINCDAKGFQISHKNKATITLSWTDVARYIDELISEGVYYQKKNALKTEESSEETPIWTEYKKLSSQYPETILFFKVGDFYEVMGENAKVCSETLDLVLTGRTVNKETKERVPMIGVPAHIVDQYVAKLVSEGHKVSIADQITDPVNHA